MLLCVNIFQKYSYYYLNIFLIVPLNIIILISFASKREKEIQDAYYLAVVWPRKRIRMDKPALLEWKNVSTF